ncbi:MAG: hypothetical protein ACYTG0_09390, partial [Planctomycetota bacterium]
MNRRILLPVFAAGAVILAVTATNAQAGLFSRGCCEPACCEPAACEPACEPACCEPECCEPACCDPCCKPRCGLLDRLRARMASRRAC